jgi:hypothetical protein
LSISRGGSVWNSFGALGQINYSGGNVGIGVTDPIYNLEKNIN